MVQSQQSMVTTKTGASVWIIYNYLASLDHRYNLLNQSKTKPTINDFNKLQQFPTAVIRATAAVELLARDGSHLVVVVPAQLLSGPHVGRGEEGDPREPLVVSVHEHVLDKNVGIAGMVEVSPNVSNGFGVHDV